MTARLILKPAAALALALALLAPAAPAATAPIDPVDCAACHVTPKPDKESHVLKPCPRPVAATPETTLEIVILDALEDLYVPVRFDHKHHSGMSKMGIRCETCHHHSESADPERPERCSKCHRKESLEENVGIPGLKGAYHRQCLKCHMEWDNHTSCAICHEKKAGGKLHGGATTYSSASHYKKMEMREFIVMKTNYSDTDSVRFTHKAHIEGYAPDCSTCHHEVTCNDCHGNENPHPIKRHKEIPMHDICLECHKDDECTRCHGTK